MYRRFHCACAGVITRQLENGIPTLLTTRCVSELAEVEEITGAPLPPAQLLSSFGRRHSSLKRLGVLCSWCTYVSLHHSCHGSTHTTKSALNATPCLLRATRQTRTWTRSRRDLPTQACECRATFGWPAFLAPQPGSGSPSTFAGAPI